MPTQEEQDKAKAKAAAEEEEAKQKEKAARDKEREQARIAKEEEAAEKQRADDLARGYTRRTLANGTVDFIAHHDQWTSPDEAVIIDHVLDYRNRARGVIV